VTRLLPARAAARLDHALSHVAGDQDEPFNGQRARAELVRHLIERLSVEAIIETGTFMGATTEFFLGFGVHVYSVETKPRFHYFARRRFRRAANVELALSDSRTYLSQLAARRDVPKQNVLFYLDAHWYDDIPLRDEVRLARQHWRDSVIVVDDFQVPYDPGYGYDEYGPGVAFSIEYLVPELDGFSVFYPSTPSGEETGHRRGSIVLAMGTAARIADDIPALTKLA
jgi:predicted O-methyltransferase YrrM